MDAFLDLIKPDRVRWVIFSVVTGYSFTLALIVMIAAVRFVRIRSLGYSFIEKRYPNIIILEGILSCIWLTFITPITLLRISKFETIKGGYYAAIWHGSYIFCNFFTQSIGNCEAARLFLVNYQIRYANILKNLEWKNQIDTKTKTDNFFLNNRDTWGNEKWIVSRLFFFYSFVALSLTGVYSFGPEVLGQTLTGVFFSFPLMIIMYLYAKCPRLNDRFLFYEEFKISSIILGSTVGFYFTMFLISQISPKMNYLCYTGVCIFATFGMFCVSFVSLVYIPSRISKYMYTSNTNELSKEMISVDSKTKEFSSVSFKFQQLLVSEDSLEEFAQHLVMEFSLECLLSFIEMNQYKQVFYEQYAEELKLMGYEPFVPHWRNITPKSTIVYAPHQFGYVDQGPKKEILYFKKVAHLLFEKYLKSYSKNEINVSNKTRRHLTGLMGDKDIWLGMQFSVQSMYTLFDQSIESMKGLLQDSSYRFYTEK